MSNRPARIKRAEKPEQCPGCGHRPVASILYGYPDFDEKLEQELDEGTVTLGGCIVSGDDPAWRCPRCGLRIFQSPMQ